ncbi:hypothetical protein PMAYCL1PPCAC_01369 [Pristionchus mayeri]|uniref:protein-tyrosine-phosphatase n=1 Tax=Pristionchus mayeri TaxID=1317129 RepID=A0AAN5C6W8_9BILA|nr:hypothetical protein PMAYCL1PPCAC_01369 [Pristionchus mayeri]
MMIDKIVDGVYLTGASAVITAEGRERLKQLEISHVLTVSAMPINEESRVKGVEYEYVYALDNPCQDLLESGAIDKSVEFIDRAVKGGGRIVVHCEVGMSRSVTMVAAYLMHRFKWDEAKAVTQIQLHRPIAFPNEGFLAQLRIYRRLGYRITHETLGASIDYRNWCIESGNVPDCGSDPRASLFVRKLETGEKKEGEEERGNKFRCGKCREPLFYTKHLMKHKRIRGVADGEAAPQCAFGYLVEPLSWMQVDAYEGKIGCPKCGDKLGNYCWGGKMCKGEIGIHCGQQVQPWVHLHKNKVDEVRSISIAIPVQTQQSFNVA